VITIEDKCAGTYAQEVDSDGCPVDPSCQEGNCNIGKVTCPNGDCSKGSEIRVETIVPTGKRKTLLDGMFSTGIAPVVCPGDTTAPMTPTMILPKPGVTPVQMDKITGHIGVVAKFANGNFSSGDEIPIQFKWTAVTDSCVPVRYGVQVEYLHCHQVAEVLDMGRYLNAGWCRWQTYLNKTTDQTQLAVQFPISRILWDLHQPFALDLGIQPPADGSNLTVIYAPQWLRARVTAFDGNANRSGSTDVTSYYVLYSKAYSIGDWTRIPVAP